MAILDHYPIEGFKGSPRLQYAVKGDICQSNSSAGLIPVVIDKQPVLVESSVTNCLVHLLGDEVRHRFGPAFGTISTPWFARMIVPYQLAPFFCRKYVLTWACPARVKNRDFLFRLLPQLWFILAQTVHTGAVRGNGLGDFNPNR